MKVWGEGEVSWKLVSGHGRVASTGWPESQQHSGTSAGRLATAAAWSSQTLGQEGSLSPQIGREMRLAVGTLPLSHCRPPEGPCHEDVRSRFSVLGPPCALVLGRHAGDPRELLTGEWSSYRRPGVL